MREIDRDILDRLADLSGSYLPGTKSWWTIWDARDEIARLRRAAELAKEPAAVGEVGR